MMTQATAIEKTLIHVTVDGQELQFETPVTILEAARSIGVRIPTLCYNEHLSAYGGCRVCLVEVTSQATPGRSRLVPACCSAVEDGLIVSTGTERVLAARRFIIELLLARCPDSGQLQELARQFGVAADGTGLDDVGRYLLTPATKREDTRCIVCSLCVRACAEISERHAISFARRGMKRKVKTPFEKIAESCIGCGSCAYVCPTRTVTVEEVS